MRLKGKVGVVTGGGAGHRPGDRFGVGQRRSGCGGFGYKWGSGF